MMRLLPERDPHAGLYSVFEEVLDRLEDPVLAAPLAVRFELQLLSELGFGLDLEQCASTGSRADLIYVSPKSGRAVSRDAGEPWADKMLRLPAFLRDPAAESGGPRSRRRLRAHRLFPGAPRAGAARARAHPTSARISSRRSCVARARHWLPAVYSAASGRSSGNGPNVSSILSECGLPSTASISS